MLAGDIFTVFDALAFAGADGWNNITASERPFIEINLYKRKECAEGETILAAAELEQRTKNELKKERNDDDPQRKQVET